MRIRPARIEETLEQGEQGCLAAAVTADNGDRLPLAHVQVQAVDGRGGSVGVGEFKILELDRIGKRGEGLGIHFGSEDGAGGDQALLTLGENVEGFKDTRGGGFGFLKGVIHLARPAK